MKKLVLIASTCVLMSCGGGGDDQGGTVLMLKSLGTLQCAQGGMTVGDLKAQLTSAGVDVVSYACGRDGADHPAVCGTSDGALGIFQIPAAQQSDAEELAFAPSSSLPAAIVVACP